MPVRHIGIHLLEFQYLRKELKVKKSILIALSVFVLALAAAGTAGATKPNPTGGHKITICHRTASYTNPYVAITVDVASTKFAGHEKHLGPVFYPSIPKHTKWGDIIPPTSDDGLRTVAPRNWPEGQAVLENGCQRPGSTTTTTGSTTTTIVDGTTTTTTTPEETTTTTTTTTTTVPPSDDSSPPRVVSSPPEVGTPGELIHTL